MKTARILQIILFLSFLLSINVTLSAQGGTPSLRETMIRDQEDRWNRSREFPRLHKNRTFDTLAAREELRAKATAKDLRAIAVSAEDKDKFAGFLKHPRTGIFRLHDISNCHESNRVYNVEEPCPLHVAAKGSAYSFTERDYEFKLLADIFLEKDNFRIRKIETLSFLTDLGDLPLENLTLASSGIREMAEFVPSLDKKQVIAQAAIATRGFQVGKHIYKTSRPMKENSTYALRSITYRFENENISVKTKRLDIVVIFRVVRKYEDGSVLVVWKELQRKDAPKLMDKKFVAQDFRSQR